MPNSLSSCSFLGSRDLAAASLARMVSNRLVEIPLSGPLVILLGDSGVTGDCLFMGVASSSLSRWTLLKSCLTEVGRRLANGGASFRLIGGGCKGLVSLAFVGVVGLSGVVMIVGVMGTVGVVGVFDIFVFGGVIDGGGRLMAKPVGLRVFLKYESIFVW